VPHWSFSSFFHQIFISQINSNVTKCEQQKSCLLPQYFTLGHLVRTSVYNFCYSDMDTGVGGEGGREGEGAEAKKN